MANPLEDRTVSHLLKVVQVAHPIVHYLIRVDGFIALDCKL